MSHCARLLVGGLARAQPGQLALLQHFGQRALQRLPRQHLQQRLHLQARVSCLADMPARTAMQLLSDKRLYLHACV